jgi:hypothetical protein
MRIDKVYVVKNDYKGEVTQQVFINEKDAILFAACIIADLMFKYSADAENNKLTADIIAHITSEDTSKMWKGIQDWNEMVLSGGDYEIYVDCVDLEYETSELQSPLEILMERKDELIAKRKLRDENRKQAKQIAFPPAPPIL